MICITARAAAKSRILSAIRRAGARVHAASQARRSTRQHDRSTRRPAAVKAAYLTLGCALYDELCEGIAFMPCCAFAAFIVSQIVLGFGVIKRFVLRSGDRLDDALSNPATEWRLIGGPPALTGPQSSRRLGVRTLAIAASIEIVLAIGAAYGYQLHTQNHHHHGRAGVASVPVPVCIR